MRLASFGLAVVLGCAGVAAALAEENSPDHPELCRGDGERRHRQRLHGRMGVHGRRRRRRLRLQRRRLCRRCCSPAARSRRSSIATPARAGGALKFAAEQSGLELDKVSGAYPLDVDSDGVTDIVLLRVGENVAMRGLGGCKFERANEAWGFDGGDAWWTALAATWEKGAEWPTIAVGSYIDRKEEISPWGSCTDNWLLRPAAGERKFAAPVAAEAELLPAVDAVHRLEPLGHAVSLRVSNDREYYEGGQEQMWKIEPGKEPALYTAAEGWRTLRIWGMGIASYDLNFDGYPEYFLTIMADNKLQTLAAVPTDGSAPKPSYADVAWPKGVTAHRPYMGEDLKPSTGWHTQFEDVNNDGLVDLFIAKGNVWEMPDFAMKDPNNLLLQQPRRQVHGSRRQGRRRQRRAGARRGARRFQPRRADRPGGRQPQFAGPALAQHQRRMPATGSR